MTGQEGGNGGIAAGDAAVHPPLRERMGGSRAAGGAMASNCGSAATGSAARDAGDAEVVSWSPPGGEGMNDHCVLVHQWPPVLRCTKCGHTEPVQLPMPISDLVALTDAFMARHRACRPRRRGDAEVVS